MMKKQIECCLSPFGKILGCETIRAARIGASIRSLVCDINRKIPPVGFPETCNPKDRFKARGPQINLERIQKIGTEVLIGKFPLDIFMPLLFIPLWCAVSVFLAFMGGWRKVAMTYRASNPFFGKKFYFQSASMRRMTNYNRVLIIGANREGLFLSVLFIFRLGHPPLFIPWAEISFKEKEEKFFDRCEITLARCPDIPIVISKRLMEKIVKSREENAPITP